MSLNLSRRSLLKALGVAAAAGALPASLSRRARAETSGIPTRFVVMPVWLGVQRWSFFPDAVRGEPFGEVDAVVDAPLPAALPEILAPLAPYRDKLLVLGGLNHQAGLDAVSSSGHSKGVFTMLSGTPNEAGRGMHSVGITIDQHIANVVRGETRFPSLEFGVMAGGARMSFRGPYRPNAPMNDPVEAFDRIFNGLLPAGTPASEMARIRARRQSILDLAADDLGALGPELGGMDKVRFDAHVESIREVEKRLTPVATSASCEPPALGAALDPMSPANIPEVSKRQLDLMAAALGCGLTNVASMQWGAPVGTPFNYSFLDIGDNFHEMSHYGDDNPGQADLLALYRWHAEQFAYLLGKLAALPESDGSSVLDHTVVLWISEMANGNSHTWNNLPVLLAGDAGGHFKTGRYVRYPQRSHNDLLIALAHAFGDPVETFGDASYCAGPLPNLT